MVTDIIGQVLVNALILLSFVELSLTVDVLTHNHVELPEVVPSNTFLEVMCHMPRIFAFQRICSNLASKYHQVDVYTLLGIQTASLLVENPYEQPTRGVGVLSQIPPDLLCTAVLLLESSGPTRISQSSSCQCICIQTEVSSA